jgi:ABC-type sulfate/molybdate transport systems ATPase subunit
MLARRPRVLILDEPFAGLDDAARRGLIAVLRRLRAEIGLTVVLVSHDTEGAEKLVDRVITLDHGRIVADGPAQELAAPAAGGRP